MPSLAMTLSKISNFTVQSLVEGILPALITIETNYSEYKSIKVPVVNFNSKSIKHLADIMGYMGPNYTFTQIFKYLNLLLSYDDEFGCTLITDIILEFKTGKPGDLSYQSKDTNALLDCLFGVPTFTGLITTLLLSRHKRNKYRIISLISDALRENRQVLKYTLSLSQTTCTMLNFYASLILTTIGIPSPSLNSEQNRIVNTVQYFKAHWNDTGSMDQLGHIINNIGKSTLLSPYECDDTVHVLLLLLLFHINHNKVPSDSVLTLLQSIMHNCGWRGLIILCQYVPYYFVLAKSTVDMVRPDSYCHYISKFSSSVLIPLLRHHCPEVKLEAMSALITISSLLVVLLNKCKYRNLEEYSSMSGQFTVDAYLKYLLVTSLSIEINHTHSIDYQFIQEVLHYVIHIAAYIYKALNPWNCKGFYDSYILLLVQLATLEYLINSLCSGGDRPMKSLLLLDYCLNEPHPIILQYLEGFYNYTLHHVTGPNSHVKVVNSPVVSYLYEYLIKPLTVNIEALCYAYQSITDTHSAVFAIQPILLKCLSQSAGHFKWRELCEVVPALYFLAGVYCKIHTTQIFPYSAQLGLFHITHLLPRIAHDLFSNVKGIALRSLVGLNQWLATLAGGEYTQKHAQCVVLPCIMRHLYHLAGHSEMDTLARVMSHDGTEFLAEFNAYIAGNVHTHESNSLILPSFQDFITTVLDGSSACNRCTMLSISFIIASNNKSSQCNFSTLLIYNLLEYLAKDLVVDCRIHCMRLIIHSFRYKSPHSVSGGENEGSNYLPTYPFSSDVIKALIHPLTATAISDDNTNVRNLAALSLAYCI